MVPWKQIEKLRKCEPVDWIDIKVFSYGYRSMLNFLGFNSSFHTKSVLEVGRVKICVQNEENQIKVAQALYRFIVAFRDLPEKDRKIWEAKHIRQIDNGEIWQEFMRGKSTPLTRETITNGSRNVARRLRIIYSFLSRCLTTDTIRAKIRYDP